MYAFHAGEEVILEDGFDSGTEIISLPNMAAGIYFLELRNNHYSETIKLIKKWGK